MQRAATISAEMIRQVKNHLLDRGQDFEKVCNQAGIPPDCAVFHDPQARLEAGAFLRLLAAAQEACADPQFGLHLGAALARNYPGGGIIMGMMANSPTVGAALGHLLRYHDLMADGLAPRMRVADGCVKLGWQSRVAGFRPPRQVVDLLLSLFWGLLALLGEGRLVLQEVRFGYPAPEDAGPYHERFGAPLKFGQAHSELRFGADFLALPVCWADASLLETLETYARKQVHRVFFADSWAHKVAEALSERLMGGMPFGLAEIGRGIGVSARSLQEKLKAEGTSYRHILAEVRQQMALRCLRAEGGVNLCDVAFLLGFSEQSAFNRAFKRWTGLSPGAYLAINR